MLLYLELAQHD